MCRHLCYLGPPVPLSSIVLDPPHSLLVQSYAPRDMRGGGSVNADGFGVGWHPVAGEPWTAPSSAAGAVRPAVVQYRRSEPIWQDVAFAQLAPQVRSGAMLAAVRNATPGMPAGPAAAAPFVSDGWMFSLNGWVSGWPKSLADLARGLPVEDLLTLDAPTDAALLWALVRCRLRDGVPAADAVRAVIAEVLAVAPDSRLNLLLTDGVTAWASTVTHSLWVRSDPALVSSEPLDADPAWQPVPEASLVRMRRDSIHIEPLAG
ncbi:MAG TPA: ergothioneine biosynthesis protein EgtC [Jatrophihabitans sp.]|nr:ergothioneine biosynthesis protein EgtC [Jatrophihabitans sp.]